MALLAANPLGYSQILEVVAVQSRALDFFQADVLQSFHTRSLHPARHGEFFGLTSTEILRRFDGFRQEAEYHGILTLVARLEAEIKSDFLLRTTQAPFDSLYRRWGAEPKMDDLMDVWKKVVPTSKTSFGNLKAARRLRHWLAHGRDFSPNIARVYSIQDIVVIVQEVSSAISSFPNALHSSFLRSRLHDFRLWVRHWRPFRWV